MRYGKPAIGNSHTGAVFVNPGQIARVRTGDSLLFLAERFRFHDATATDHRIVTPVRAIGRHSIFGPYVRLPAGQYQAIFDLDFWGYCTNASDVYVVVDISDGQSTPLLRKRMAVSDVLTAHGVVSMEFLHTREKADLEFRVEFEGEAPDLRATFQGVRLRVVSAY